MTGPEVRGVRLADGRQVRLGGVIRLEIAAALDSPAVSMTGDFAVDRSPGELGGITVAWKDRELFAGSCDLQRLRLDGNGTVLRLEARSRGGLLLDNEALPCALANVGLETVFGLFIQPYGFVCYAPGPRKMLGSYVVRKGISEWEALTGFTRRAYGITPYVQGEQVMVDVPRSAAPLKLGSREGVPLARLDHVHCPYNILSKVVMRDEEGRYSSGMTNPNAAYYGVSRKRYVIPSSEFTDNLALDANRRIRRSMLDREEVTARIPGFLYTRVGQEVQIREGTVDLYNLLIKELRYGLDGDGFYTRLDLVSTVYYE